MVKVVGIGFKEVGKVYYFDPTPFDLKIDDMVVVETIRGIELGKVVLPIKEVDEQTLEHELKGVIRIATDADIKAFKENQKKAAKTLEKCKEIVKTHSLEMKLLDCEYTLDRSKVIFYYNADGRVDFRELLKDLASEFKVRIELRQIGPREGAKFLGGIGQCGREVCCKKHLREFDIVTMKMAKDQGMTLNASKVAGLCGKLMCCIGYENELYQELRKRVPLVGDLVKTPTCSCCKVVSVDLLKEIVRTLKDDGETVEVWKASELVKLQSTEEVINPEDLTDDVNEDGTNT